MSTDSDPPTEAELREIVRDELAKQTEADHGPETTSTRREVMKALGLAGTAGVLGGAGVNAATDTASAGTQSTGSVGTAANPIDVEAEDINTTTIQTERESNKLQARNYSGTTLSDKVQNAINDVKNNMAGMGLIEVSGPPDGGGYWDWDDEVSIDPSNFEWLTIDFHTSKIMSKVGGGYCIKVPDAAGVQEGLNIIGGWWNGTNATDPAGWFHAHDLRSSHIEPLRLQGFSNTNADSHGIRLETASDFCTFNVIGGHMKTTDIPLFFDRGAGNGNFANNRLDGIHAEGKTTCVQVDGDLRNSYVEKLSAYPSANNAVGLHLDGNISETVFQSVEIEDPGDTYTGNIGIETGANYSGHAPPVFHGLRVDSLSIGTRWSRSTASDRIYNIYTESTGERFRLENMGDQVIFEMDPGRVRTWPSFATGSKVLFENGVKTQGELEAQTTIFNLQQDLTATGAPAPSRKDKYATHDGTGTPGPGLYRSDPANSQWVKVEDNTVTIAY